MASLTAGTDQDIPPYDPMDLCPVCQSNRYLNPDMKFLVSSCYHRLCESCVERLFGGGPAKCPVCGLVIRKGAFYRQIFEDLTVEKEVRVRKRVARIFNKRESDFKSLRAYNDYLEFVENIGKYIGQGQQCFSLRRQRPASLPGCKHLYLCSPVLTLYVVYNLTNEIDVQETEAIIEKYEQDNKDIIKRNSSRQA
ncbi:TFIIH/NER complex subunit, partial [Spiromyces aspiralis]